MKKIFIAALWSFTLVTFQAIGSPDIMIETKLNYEFSALLLKKYQTLSSTFGIPDPFSQKFETPVLLNESKIEGLLPESSKSMLEGFGNAIGFQILETKTKVLMHGFEYQVKNFRTDISVKEQTADGLVIAADLKAEEVTVSADKITLTLVIPGQSASPIFSVDVLKPILKASRQQLFSIMSPLVRIRDNNHHLNLEILSSGVDKMLEDLLLEQPSIQLDFERISIPKISLRIGNRMVNFSPERIEKLIRSYRPALKGLLIAQTADMLKTNTSDANLKIVQNIKMKKDFWIPTPLIETYFRLGNFSRGSEGENLRVVLDGGFCPKKSFKSNLERCLDNQIVLTAPSRLGPQHHRDSLATIGNLMESDQVGLVASFSENYLNKLLASTFEMGLWDSALKEANVRLGPNKMRLLLNHQGETGTFIMDVLYEPSRVERILTGSTQIRFPLAVDVSFQIEKRDNAPVIIVRLHNVDTSDETLISGRDGFVSTVQHLSRFKAKVAKAIREKIAPLSNKDIIELKYPELGGLGLERLEFISDGNGRMNAIMSFEDLLTEGHQK